MNILDWAKKEVEIACKRENPDWDGKSFDYGCACYQSALKAYESLCNDEHSGASFAITKSILIRLMNHLPLKPILDEDFIIDQNMPQDNPEYLKKRGLKSNIQCPRMFGLFRYEDLNGKVTYHDVDRAVGIDTDGITYHSGLTSQYVDKLFPITMPYYPPAGKYYVYTDTFLLDSKNGDFDHRAILYIKTPEGDKVDINEFFKEVDGEWTSITKEEFYNNKEKRID